MESQKMLNPLENQSVGRAFLRYLIPSLLGMLLVAVNIVVDGIMVGNKLGAEALAGIGIASPVYTLLIAMSLWLGIGGATLYSQAMGARDTDKAKRIFAQSLTVIFSVTLIIGVTAFIFREPLVYGLGANSDTYPHAMAYITVMLLLGFVFTVENALSIFVRNDGNPNLAMAAQITFALSNIGINYIVLYVLDLGVAGVATGTIIAASLGLLVLLTHFTRKANNLHLRRFKWDRVLFVSAVIIGFPSFLAEVGISVFTISHNLSLEHLAGTSGVAAFSIINYTHSVVLLTFLGMGSAIQPLVSYYHGARQEERKRQTLRIALWTAAGAGVALLVFIQLFTPWIVGIFGDFTPAVKQTAVDGFQIFVFAYAFMGMNFVMMTYFQSVDHVRMAVWITAAREIIIMLLFLLILPPWLGITGVWLAVPLSEAIVLLTIVVYYRKYGAITSPARLGADR
ncbi:MATE family efflux transporter [Paenibacillus daejeonensis]|uniref:MATE family efflux transporter n=1 Tax=Paenibacillus daejeonensis TaxID=135193 RepID=UPI00039F50D8|nr:MATE family efflux transporter [Paenibacillus daejeonensis]